MSLKYEPASVPQHRPPVNSLNAAMVHEITAAIKSAEYDKDLRG